MSAGAMAPSLSPTSSNAQLAAAPPAPAQTCVVDVEAIVRKLKEQDSAKLDELLVTFDDKELVAAGKYMLKAKRLKLRKKEAELRKKWWWRLRGTGGLEEKLKWAKKDIEKKLSEAKKNIAEKLKESKKSLEEKLEEAHEDVNAEFAIPKHPECYEEIKRLLYIEKNPVFAKALVEWSRKETLFTNRVDRKKSKVADLKNEIYQLLGFFSVFQGVLLTAVSQSNLLHCNNLWSPIGLSLVASGVTIVGFFQKLLQIDAFQNTIHSEEQSLKKVAARVNTLRDNGTDQFEFAQFSNREYKAQSKRRFRFYLSLIIFGLFLFTVGFPISHWRILCDPGPNPYAATARNSQ